MTNLRAAIGAVLAIVAVVLAAGCGGGGGSTTAGPTETAGGASSAAGGESAGGESGAEPTIVVKNGEPVGGVKTLEYSAGEQVRFKVRSDVADEVHVHGYDLMKDVPAGGTVSFSFPAEIEGIFEAELEEHHEQILELRVNP